MPSHTVALTGCLLLSAVLAAGCSTHRSAPGLASGTASETGSGTASSTPPSSSAPPPSTTSTTPPTTAPPPAPSPGAAADGTNYATCADSDCEVFVSGTATIPLDQRFGFTRFVVTHDATGQTSVFGEDPVNGNLRAYVMGTGEISANEITMRVLSTDETGVLLRFTPRV